MFREEEGLHPGTSVLRFRKSKYAEEEEEVLERRKQEVAAALEIDRDTTRGRVRKSEALWGK